MADTALDVITSAMRKLRILGAGAVPTSSETEDGLEALNDMLASWRINGVDLALTELQSTDPIDVPDDHLEAIKLNLAARIADEYGAQLTPLLAMDAMASKAALVAYHWSANDLSDDNPLAYCNQANSLSG